MVFECHPDSRSASASQADFSQDGMLASRELSGRESTTLARNLAAQASSPLMQGKELWHADGLNIPAQLGGAQAITNMLEQNHVRGLHDAASVKNLVGELQSCDVGQGNQWTPAPLSARQPGDLVYGMRGDRGFVGIIGEDGNLYGNHSATGAWGMLARGNEIESFGHGMGIELTVLKPPSKLSF